MTTPPMPRPHDDVHARVAHPLPLVAGVLAVALLCGATQIVGAPVAPVLHRMHAAHVHVRDAAMAAVDATPDADLRDGLAPCVMVDVPPASADAISL